MKDLKVLVREKEIKKHVKRIANTLDERYEGMGDKLVIVPILQGAIPFFSDIAKAMTLDCLVDTVGVRSYVGKVQGEFDLYKDFNSNLSGKHVWLIDDIADSGNTLTYLKNIAKQRGAVSVHTCTMLKRKSCPIHVDLFGREIDGEWVVGYGMDDVNGLGRTLNDIVVV